MKVWPLRPVPPRPVPPRPPLIVIPFDPRGYHISKWGKRSVEGLPIPSRCPHCGSRKTRLATYKGGSKTVECEGCYQIILEYPHNNTHLRLPFRYHS